jgi:hypothetical protein
MTITILDVAQEIFHDLFEPTDISVGSITFWLRANFGELNNRIGTSYELDGDAMEITPALNVESKAILKKLYHVHYLDKQIRDNLGASGTQSVIEVDEFGSKVRMTNKTETAKTYTALRKEIAEELKGLIISYKSNSVTPLQVSGDDMLSESGLESQDIRYNRS